MQSQSAPFNPDFLKTFFLFGSAKVVDFFKPPNLFF